MEGLVRAPVAWPVFGLKNSFRLFFVQKLRVSVYRYAKRPLCGQYALTFLENLRIEIFKKQLPGGVSGNFFAKMRHFDKKNSYHTHAQAFVCTYETPHRCPEPIRDFFTTAKLARRERILRERLRRPPKNPVRGALFAAPSLSPAKKTKKGGKTFPPFLFFFVFFIRGWKNGFHNGLLNAHFENFIFKRPASALCFRVLVSGTEKISDKSG